FQAEDGIRDGHVTGVQTCALPISCTLCVKPASNSMFLRCRNQQRPATLNPYRLRLSLQTKLRSPDSNPQGCSMYVSSFNPECRRSEERRVGKEWRLRWCG